MFNHSIINIIIHNISNKITYVDIAVEDLLPVSYTKVVILRKLKVEIVITKHLQGILSGKISIGS